MLQRIWLGIKATVLELGFLFLMLYFFMFLRIAMEEKGSKCLSGPLGVCSKGVLVFYWGK